MIKTVFINSIQKVGPTGLAYGLIQMTKNNFWQDKSMVEMSKLLNALETEDAIGIYKETIERIDGLKNKDNIIHIGELALSKMKLVLEYEISTR